MINAGIAILAVVAGLVLGYLAREHLAMARPWIGHLALGAAFVGWALQGGMEALR